jgi:hypothetical protein
MQAYSTVGTPDYVSLFLLPSPFRSLPVSDLKLNPSFLPGTLFPDFARNLPAAGLFERVRLVVARVRSSSPRLSVPFSSAQISDFAEDIS